MLQPPPATDAMPATAEPTEQTPLRGVSRESASVNVAGCPDVCIIEDYEETPRERRLKQVQDHPALFFEPELQEARDAIEAMQPDVSERGMSFFGAALNMVKLMLGAGVLALPNAWSHAGLWAAVGSYPVLGVVAWLTMMLLLETKNKACAIIHQRRQQYAEYLEELARYREQLHRAQEEESADAAAAATTTTTEVEREMQAEPQLTETLAEFGPSNTFGALDSVTYVPPKGSLDLVRTYRGVGAFAFGPVGKWAVIVAVVALQLCFSTGYVIVAASTFESYLPKLNRAIVLFAILMPICGALAMIRWIRDLTFVSVFGTLVYVAGVIGVTFYLGLPVVFAPNAPDHTQPVVWSSLPLFVGTALYSIEGINGVLPIEGAMERPRRAPTAMLVATMGYVGIAAVFATVAYAAGFGSYDVITHAFPAGTTRAIIEWALVVSLILTYPLQLYPATETLEEQFLDPKGRAYKRVLLRLGLVLTTIAMAYFMRNFSLFSGLVGSLFLSFSGFIVPSLAYLRIVGRSGGFIKAGAAALILVGGLVLLVVGTYRSILEFVRS